MKYSKFSIVLLVAVATALLLLGTVGCSVSGNKLLSADRLSLAGTVQGALQPIANAEVHLYALDPHNPAARQNVELTQAVRTDSQGAFRFPESVACPSSDSLLYVESRGGVPAATGFANASITLLNAIGICSDVAPQTTVTVNEVTTVGSAWPLAAFVNDSGQFVLGSGQADEFNAAVRTVGKLVNAVTGQSPGLLLAAGEAAPVTAINSVANAISACLVTNGGSAGDRNACGHLFSLAGSDSAAMPKDTLAAALLIAKNPARNVAGLYTLAATRTVFEPSLTSAPSDWTLQTKTVSTPTVVASGIAVSPTLSTDNAGAAAATTSIGTQSTTPAVSRPTAQDTPLVANTIVIKTGGTYQGNWVSTDPTVPPVSIQTDQPVVIQNSTVTGPGTLIAVIGSVAANLTVLNVTGTGVDPLIAGKTRGAFVLAYKMNSLTVQNCTMSGTQFGIKFANSTATSVHILNNRAINLEDRASDGNGGFQTARPQLGHFVLFYQVVAPNGAEVGWNQMVQTIGQSSVDNGIELFKSQGTASAPILVHDNYLEGNSSPVNSTYGASAIATTGDNTALETTYVQMLANDVVHTAGNGIYISNGHDVSAQGTRIVSCGQDSSGNWYSRLGLYGVVLWNRSASPTFSNNTITASVGGLIVPATGNVPAAADAYANPPDLQDASNSISGNLFTDPCLAGGALTLSAEDTERAYWANKLSSNSQTVGDQHGPVAVTVTPATYALGQTQTQQFTAAVAWASNTSVTWAISPSVGTISTSGLYTAPASVTTQQTVTVTATSAQDGTTTGSATITLNPAVTVAVTPVSANLQPAATQQFTATVSNATNTAVTWSMNPAVGTVSPTGLYTAPASIAAGQAVTVTATSVADTTVSTSAVINLQPAVAVSVMPGTSMVAIGSAQQFGATVTNASNSAVTWSIGSGAGSLSSTGLYTAPATGASPGQTVTIIATSVADTTKAASAIVTLSPPVAVSVAGGGTTIGLGQTVAFTAAVANTSNTAVVWSINPLVGSVSSAGVYTAPSSISSTQVVTVTATSLADSSKSGSATVTVSAGAVLMNPSAVTLYASQTQQFSAQIQNSASQAITWTLSPATGSISATGLYTAPSSISAVTNVSIKAASTANPQSYTTSSITLMPAVKVTLPNSYASLSVSQTKQFTATVANSSNMAVTWSISPAVGTIDNTGLYTAPATLATSTTVTFTATSVADPTKSASGTIVVLPPIGVNVTPGAASLLASGTQQFTATVYYTTNTAVTWSLSPSVGTLSATGLYTAPASITASQTVTITATSTADTTKTASAQVSLSPPVAINVTPGAASLLASGTQQFSATVYWTKNTAVTWSMSPSVGTLSATGLYTAPGSITAVQTVTVTATSVADPTKSAGAIITLNPPVAINLAPSGVTLYANATQQFRAAVYWTTNTAVTWSLSPAVGTLSSNGLYTAPSFIAANSTVTITTTSVADPTKSASATVSLNRAVSVNVAPALVSLVPNQTQQFTPGVYWTTNTAVTWSLSPNVGSISSAGLYTAPAVNPTAQNVTVTMTSVADPTKSASATVSLVGVLPGTLYINSGGTYSGNWSSSSPMVPAITVVTDDPVVIQNSTLSGLGDLIQIRGKSGANVTVQNVTGTALDPQVSGAQRGSFVNAYTVNSLVVTNNTVNGASIGIYVGRSTLATLSITRNRGINLEDRASDGNGGLLTTRPVLGHFVEIAASTAPSGAEIAWNEVKQTIGASSVEDVFSTYGSQGATGSPIWFHDNYMEGYSSSSPANYSGTGMIADGDATNVSAFVKFEANEMVHAGGGAIDVASGHDVTALNNRVVSCGKDSAGNWYTAIYHVAITLQNFYGAAQYYNNTITGTQGGMVAPNTQGLPAVSDVYVASNVDMTQGNSVSGNAFTDPCLVNGVLNIGAEDTERSFWANKLATNNIVLGDQH